MRAAGSRSGGSAPCAACSAPIGGRGGEAPSKAKSWTLPLKIFLLFIRHCSLKMKSALKLSTVWSHCGSESSSARHAGTTVLQSMDSGARILFVGVTGGDVVSKTVPSLLWKCYKSKNVKNTQHSSFYTKPLMWHRHCAELRRCL